MDLISIAVGAIAGGAIGFIAASIHAGAESDKLYAAHEELRLQFEALYRKYSRLTDRDERGRFKGNKK